MHSFFLYLISILRLDNNYEISTTSFIDYHASTTMQYHSKVCDIGMGLDKFPCIGMYINNSIPSSYLMSFSKLSHHDTSLSGNAEKFRALRSFFNEIRFGNNLKSLTNECLTSFGYEDFAKRCEAFSKH